MPKVLFMGCNHNQIPYLKAAQILGYEVIGTDINPKAPGASIADKFYPVGYNDSENLISLALSENFNAEDKIFTASAHFALEGAAGVASKLGIDFIPPETVDICINKSKFYPFLTELGIPIPQTKLIKPGKKLRLNTDKVYYLKSDYGKSPYYCYKITHGQKPPFPDDFDRYYRSCFLLQEEIKGLHYRINLYAGQAGIFLKFTDLCSVPIPILGAGHAPIVEALRKITEKLGISHLLTKFDLIIDETGWYVIDIGLDPPMRLKLLCGFFGVDFPYDYICYYLLKDPSALPDWEEICKPVIIRGEPLKGYQLINLGETE